MVLLCSGGLLPLLFLSSVSQTLHVLESPDTYGLHEGTREYRSFVHELVAEARLLNQLDHLNVVSCLGLVPRAGQPHWIVMERCTVLPTWLSSGGGSLPLSTLCKIAVDVFGGLVYVSPRAWAFAGDPSSPGSSPPSFSSLFSAGTCMGIFQRLLFTLT
jgi:hypothetical protein